MKYVKYLAAFAVICLMTAVSSFASTKSKDVGHLNIDEPVQVGSTHLSPGDYKVEWNGNANNVQINILKGKDVVATTEGKVVELDKPAKGDAVTTKSPDNNTRVIDEIEFNNRKESLVLNQGDMATK
jgi:hypothetical protein